MTKVPNFTIREIVAHGYPSWWYDLSMSERARLYNEQYAKEGGMKDESTDVMEAEDQLDDVEFHQPGIGQKVFAATRTKCGCLVAMVMDPRDFPEGGKDYRKAASTFIGKLVEVGLVVQRMEQFAAMGLSVACDTCDPPPAVPDQMEFPTIGGQVRTGEEDAEGDFPAGPPLPGGE